MGPIGGGGGALGGAELGGGSKIFLGHFYEILDISSELSAQAQSIGTLFGHIWLRVGGL